MLDIEQIKRQRAIRHAEQGDNGPAREAQEDLLDRLIGQGRNALKFQIINPRDPIKGLWESLHLVARPGAKSVALGNFALPGAKRGVVAHTEDAGEPYTLMARQRIVSLPSNYKKAYLEFVSFDLGGINYLKLFGAMVDEHYEELRKTVMLYKREADGRWQRRDRNSLPKSDEWLTASERYAFLAGAAKRNVHRDKIAIDHFDFVPEPDRRDPIPPPRLQQRKAA